MGYALVFQIPCPDRCLNPVQTAPEKACRRSKYSQSIFEDFGSLGMLVPWRKSLFSLITWNVLRSKTGDEHSSQLCGGISAFSRLEFDSSPGILWPLASVGRLYIYLTELQTCPLKINHFKGLFLFRTIIFQETCQFWGGSMFTYMCLICMVNVAKHTIHWSYGWGIWPQFYVINH